MNINNKYIFYKSLSLGNRKICNVGLSILRRSFLSGFAPALSKVSVIEENLKPKSHKSKKENSENERPESVDELERLASPQPLESPAINASRALTMQPFLPLFREMPHKNPLSQGSSPSKQSPDRQVALGSQANKEGATHRNPGLMELSRVELASKPTSGIEEKPPATLLRDAALEKPEERITPNEPMRLREENPHGRAPQIETGEKIAISSFPSSLEQIEMIRIATVAEADNVEAPFSQREILRGAINNPRIEKDLSLGIEKGEKSGPVESDPAVASLSTGSSAQDVAKTMGEFRSHPLTSIERGNPVSIKYKPEHLESVPFPLQGKMADREQAAKPIPIQIKAIENQLEKPSMQVSCLGEIESERIVEKEILTNPSFSKKPIAVPPQGGDLTSPLSLPKESAILTRSHKSSDSHFLPKNHKPAHEIGHSARKESLAQTPLRTPQDTGPLTRSVPVAAHSETNPMKAASSPFAVAGQKVIGATFSPAANSITAALRNVEMPQSETPVSRIIAVSKTIAEPAIARFAEFPSVSREPKAVLEEPAQPLSEHPSLNDPEPEQKPEFTVRIYSQPIIIDNYYGVGRL